MTGSTMSVSAITLFAEDLQRSRSFYERVFELKPVYEDANSAVFGFANTLINLLAVPAARELIEPGVVGRSDAGSRFQLTLSVDDADAACATLEARGVTLLNGPVDREWGVRTASFSDPAGHIWEVAQQLSPSEAS